MKDELDKQLCEKFPKLFKDRYAPMNSTCMCWGFDHGDGWYNIIRALCSNIQHHVDWKRKNRATALRYNRCLKRALSGDTAGLTWYYSRGEAGITPWTIKYVERDIQEASYREVPDAVHQVTVTQVKEKLGTLRFYYSGGDDEIYGMVRMAESMSAVTCEECGSPGKVRSGGWLRCLCDAHTKGTHVSDEDESIEP